MLSNAQKALIKRAQAQATISDFEYRDAISAVSGFEDCRSSKDDRLTDEHLDKLLSYIEAIYWRKVDANELQHAFNPRAVFKQQGYWASKNRRDNTSRDRYTQSAGQDRIASLEADLAAFGCNAGYFAAIRAKIGQDHPIQYAAALTRTLASKRRTAAKQAAQPSV